MFKKSPLLREYSTGLIFWIPWPGRNRCHQADSGDEGSYSHTESLLDMEALR